MVQGPNRCCDLVMKGGITSGILYPNAVHEIARRFHFIGIAGSSAGAIAACVTAAAEYRRRQDGSFEGYEMLQDVAKELAEPGRLLSLFQPDASTASLFRLALDAFTGGGFAKVRLLGRLAFAASRDSLFEKLIRNGYGLCSGMANGSPSQGHLPLTQWLSDTINRVSGKAGPLTFRDLHEATIPPTVEQIAGTAPRRSIDLRAITTCVTFERPLEFPLRQKIFAFDPEEWARLFPRDVLAHVIRAGNAISCDLLKRDGKLPLPTDDLPIVVAARMSLSFPLLFSMVPLWSPNHHQDGSPLMRAWFSDGGITSNFPIHRFDALYPRWPTIGISLQYTGADGKPQRPGLRRTSKYVYLPEQRPDGARDLWNVLEGKDSSASQFLGFGMSIFRSAQNWHDNSFLKLPGYRDRAVEIWLKPDEGGLNLEMPGEVILGLLERGSEAGKLAVEHFADRAQSESMSWSGHRWTRFRSNIAGLMESIRRFSQAVPTRMAEDPTLFDMLSDRHVAPAYQFNEDQREAAEAAVQMLVKLAEAPDLFPPDAPADSMDSPFYDGPEPRVTNGSRAPF